METEIMTGRPPTSNIAAFFETLWGRILAVLTALALLLGIANEGLSALRGKRVQNHACRASRFLWCSAKLTSSIFSFFAMRHAVTGFTPHNRAACLATRCSRSDATTAA
jgi:hypothetical protein